MPYVLWEVLSATYNAPRILLRNLVARLILESSLPSTSMAAAKRIAILMRNPETGGVERMLVNLAQGFAQRGFPVDLIVGARDNPYFENLHPSINLIWLGSIEPAQFLPALSAHLSSQRPAVLMAAKDEDCALAGAVKLRLANPPRVFLRASVDYSGQLVGRRAGRLKTWWRHRQVRRLFERADELICVSEGVARDMRRILSHRQMKTHVLPNPTITAQLADGAARALAHPWFAPGQPPVILGVGRLAPIKNFSLLLRAFARVHAQLNCRLVIVGDGKQREQLLALADSLNVRDCFDLPGFDANPYAYMARCALFVLSSAWEGLGNVLVEAMACGAPVVSTDCPSGPAEILEGGRLGPLVPLNDDTALADAMLARLRAPRDSEALRAAVARFTIENSSAAYLRAFGLQ